MPGRKVLEALLSEDAMTRDLAKIDNLDGQQLKVVLASGGLILETAEARESHEICDALREILRVRQAKEARRARQARLRSCVELCREFQIPVPTHIEEELNQP